MSLISFLFVIGGALGLDRVSWGVSFGGCSFIMRTESLKSWAHYPVSSLQEYLTILMTFRNLVYKSTDPYWWYSEIYRIEILMGL